MTLTMATKKETRAYVQHKPKWQRYQTTLMKVATTSAAASGGKQKPTLHPYQRQYAHVYHQRLAALKPRCWQSVDAAGLDKDISKMDRILEVKENVKSVIVGTVVKEGTSGAKLHPESRCLSGQTVFIEDESGRVNLEVENVHDFCTGMVLGLLGTVGESGTFQVEQVFYPALAPVPSMTETPADAATTEANKKPAQILFLSGMNFGDPDESPLRRDMVLAYLRGHFGNPKAASQVAHVIVAGGSTVKHDEHPTVAMKELDYFCLQICALGVPVDVLPGKDDPTTANWPQRPLHRSLLKYSDQHLSHLLSRVPNPYGAMFGSNQTYILGTDGTNVTDLAQSLLTPNDNANGQEGADDDDPKWMPVSHLEALKRTLKCGHVCPTGPDTIPTIPHPESDPMVIAETPQIYFAGNCDEFATEIYEDNNMKCRLVCLPQFSATGQGVLVDLETLHAKPIGFQDP